MGDDDSIAAANAVVQAGKVRRLAGTSGKRFPGLPELPSLNETVPGIVMDGFFAVWRPRGAPADVVARLNREIARYLEGSDIRERLLAIGLATEGGGTPETTASHPAGAEAVACAGEGIGCRRPQ